MDSSVRLERPTEGVVKIVVDRPQYRNALDFAMQKRLGELLIECANDKEIVALIVTGVGPSFLAGGDLRELAKFSGPEDGLRLSTALGDALLEVEQSPLCIIAAINGATRGGGAEIAVSSDWRFMAKDADIAFVHTRLGLTPGWGGRRRLEQIVGEGVAGDLLTTARVLTAAEAAEIGLVDAVLRQDELDSEVLRVAVAVRDGDVQPDKGRALADRRETRRQMLGERAQFLKCWNMPERKRAFGKYAAK